MSTSGDEATKGAPHPALTSAQETEAVRKQITPTGDNVSGDGGASADRAASDAPPEDGTGKPDSSSSNSADQPNKSGLTSESCVQELTFGSVRVEDGVDEADGVTFAPLHDDEDEDNGGTDVRRTRSKLAHPAPGSVSTFSIRTTIGGNVDISWHHVSVTLPKDEKAKRFNPKVILNDITGRLEAGNLMALMGASGAGKTTFLNLISGRISSALDVEGVLAINGRTVTPHNVRKIAAYVQQQDVFLGNLTVYEHLRIQAMLRMDNTTSIPEREEQIEKVMLELGLVKVRDTRIGNPITGTRGISGGEAKRLAFASEILTDPPLLFADEPTSGLDSFAAQNVVLALKKLADNGHTVICTIHQPPSEVFLHFHKLLLVAEGRTAYLGNISGGTAAFEKLGYPCPPNYNHADFYIHTLAIVPGKEEECRARVKAITDAYHEKEVAEGSTQGPEPESQQMTETLRDMSHRRRQPVLVQGRHVLLRSFLTAMREFQVVGVQLMQTLVMATLFGLVYLQIDNDGNGQDRAQNFAGATLMVTINATFSTLYPVVQVLPAEIVVLIRDHDNHMYKTWIFYASKFVAEIPIVSAYVFLLSLITYFMIGFRTDADAFFTYYAILLVSAMIARALGFFISAVAFDNAQLALAMVTPIAVPLMLFSGVFLNSENVPVYLIWLDAISMFKYEWEAMMINEFDGLVLAGVGGCVNSSRLCYETGNQILTQYSLGSGLDRICRNFGIMLGLFFAYLIMGLIILIMRVRFLKR